MANDDKSQQPIVAHIGRTAAGSSVTCGDTSLESVYRVDVSCEAGEQTKADIYVRPEQVNLEVWPDDVTVILQHGDSEWRARQAIEVLGEYLDDKGGGVTDHVERPQDLEYWKEPVEQDDKRFYVDRRLVPGVQFRFDILIDLHPTHRPDVGLLKGKVHVHACLEHPDGLPEMFPVRSIQDEADRETAITFTVCDAYDAYQSVATLSDIRCFERRVYLYGRRQPQIVDANKWLEGTTHQRRIPECERPPAGGDQ